MRKTSQKMYPKVSSKAKVRKGQGPARVTVGVAQGLSEAGNRKTPTPGRPAMPHLLPSPQPSQDQAAAKPSQANPRSPPPATPSPHSLDGSQGTALQGEVVDPEQLCGTTMPAGSLTLSPHSTPASRLQSLSSGQSMAVGSPASSVRHTWTPSRLAELQAGKHQERVLEHAGSM